jgi:hypothetical protein
MARSPAIEQEKKIQESKPLSPHLAWQVPQRSPNAAAIQKGQLGQNVRQQEKAARKGR